MIKKISEKDNRTCYRVSGSHRLDPIGIFRMPGVKEFVAGYSNYSSMWYAYDPDTGDLVADFRPEFYDQAIKPYKVGDVLRDLEGKCA